MSLSTAAIGLKAKRTGRIGNYIGLTGELANLKSLKATSDCLESITRFLLPAKFVILLNASLSICNKTTS